MLNIESPDELAIAERAIAEYRKTRVRHVGLHARRMNLPCEQTTRERAFSEEWLKEAAPQSGINGGRGAAELLLCTAPNTNEIIRELTPIEATAAATVIQWLGTNCGFDFLCRALRNAGYSEPRKLPEPRP